MHIWILHCLVGIPAKFCFDISTPVCSTGIWLSCCSYLWRLWSRKL